MLKSLYLNAGCVYLLNTLLSFQIGTVLINRVYKISTTNGRTTAVAYVLYGWFWLDIVAVVPFFYLVVVLAGQIPPANWVVYVSLLRILRMTRLASVAKARLSSR